MAMFDKPYHTQDISSIRDSNPNCTGWRCRGGECRCSHWQPGTVQPPASPPAGRHAKFLHFVESEWLSGANTNLHRSSHWLRQQLNAGGGPARRADRRGAVDTARLRVAVEALDHFDDVLALRREKLAALQGLAEVSVPGSVAYLRYEDVAADQGGAACAVGRQFGLALADPRHFHYATQRVLSNGKKSSRMDGVFLWPRQRNYMDRGTAAGAAALAAVCGRLDWELEGEIGYPFEASGCTRL
jgi:hypothetical protein